MLDPDLIEELAAAPEKNAPAVNLALAEEGHAPVLIALAESPATAIDALDMIAQRLRDGDIESVEDEDDDDDDDIEREPPELVLDRLLIAHPHASDDTRDEVLARHPDDAFFVLAAASHARATLGAVERAARWPSRFSVYDRRWLALIESSALPPLTAEAWAQDPSVLLRETVGLLSDDETLLERLSRDPRRRVRRAVASNPLAHEQRQRMATDDPAAEVRRRAASLRGHHQALRSTEQESSTSGPMSARVDGARFASALRAMQTGGVLAPDIAASLAQDELDEEGALLASLVLSHEPLVSRVRQAAELSPPTRSCMGLAAGLALRVPEDDDAFRDLVVDAAKALSGAAQLYGTLTGKARLAAWLSDGVARCQCIDHGAMARAICGQVLAGEGAVLARGMTLSPALLDALCAASGDKVAPALLELAWKSPEVSDDAVLAMAKRIVRNKRRGQDLQEDEVDLDPMARSLEVLERAVLLIGKRVTVSPRSALPVIALDSRRVRYVLTALPSWRGRLSGTMLARVLRQRAGALSAARSESRSLKAEVREWTERIMTDTEVAVAIAVGHYTAAALIERIGHGRHELIDGGSIASGAEARAAVEGAESVKPLLRWAARGRSKSGAALAIWLLLERHDRVRPAGMIASAVDTMAHAMAQRGSGVSETVSDALATLERREPGRLETIFPQTPRGKATMASAIARAYRALGGLRAER